MRGLIAFLLVLTSISLHAQEIPCAQIIQKSIDLKKTTTLRNNDIIIPVVFHIVYRTEDQNTSAEAIVNKLESLNADFNLKNRDNIPSQSLGNVGNVGFQFKLAEIDPEGESTKGIERIQTDQLKIGNLFDVEGISQIKQSDFGGSDPWPTENYLNIWVGERTQSLGYTFSKNSIGTDLIGIVLDYRTLSPSDRTLTHEMGHFFGLLHPWGNNTGCDGEDDGIADTPYQAYPDFSCSPVLECGIKSKTGNFMDFSPDECLRYFTKGQALSMQQFTNQFMLELIQSNDCFIANFPENEKLYYYNKSYRGIEVYFSKRNEANIKMYSMDGKAILSSVSKSENYINISTDGIPSGIYVLHFIVGDEISAHKIFIY